MPVSILERRGVFCNEFLARLHAGETGFFGARRLIVDISSPIATEGGVKDELLVDEPLVKVARALEAGIGSSKIGNIGSVVGDTGGYFVAWEEPHLDSGRGPFHGEYSPVVVIETHAKGVWLRRDYLRWQK